MEFLARVFDFFLHIDKHLLEVVTTYGTWTYAILFAIVFLETGFVVTPFLPGDSLLFAAGALAGAGALDVVWVMVLLTIAAILGDSVNYAIGRAFGVRAFTEGSRFFKEEYLLRTQRFYEKHGGKTIVLARFVPIVRTFAPFVAGVGRMRYVRFWAYNAAGGVLWVVSLTLLGYFFGTIPFVKENFTVAILVIVLLSVVPVFVEMAKHRIQRSRAAAGEQS
ncbi:MAG TPA: DedA family protein [Candidatus Krumholzibacteria bacterium]|nr:DedA family protein [Candidatus Krumholzibacteria bacterium]